MNHFSQQTSGMSINTISKNYLLVIHNNCVYLESTNMCTGDTGTSKILELDFEPDHEYVNTLKTLLFGIFAPTEHVYSKRHSRHPKQDYSCISLAYPSPPGDIKNTISAFNTLYFTNKQTQLRVQQLEQQLNSYPIYDNSD